VDVPSKCTVVEIIERVSQCARQRKAPPAAGREAKVTPKKKHVKDS